jgi:hypothetical protein
MSEHLMELEVFSSVWFLPIKNNRTEKKTEPKPVQTDRFLFGFSLVFDAQNRKNLYAFFGLYLAL